MKLFHFPLPHNKSDVFDLQLMSQMRWFHKLSSVILIILAHYWDYELNRRVCCAHHCISDDLNKSNEQMTHCFDFVRYTLLLSKLTIEQNFLHRHQRICASFAVRNFYDRKNAQLVPPQPQHKHLHIVTDNAGNQCKNVYQFSWMIDYVNEDHGLETIQHNFSCEAHGKGIHDAEGGVKHSSSNENLFFYSFI